MHVDQIKGKDIVPTDDLWIFLENQVPEAFHQIPFGLVTEYFDAWSKFVHVEIDEFALFALTEGQDVLFKGILSATVATKDTRNLKDLVTGFGATRGDIGIGRVDFNVKGENVGTSRCQIGLIDRCDGSKSDKVFVSTETFLLVFLVDTTATKGKPAGWFDVHHAHELEDGVGVGFVGF